VADGSVCQGGSATLLQPGASLAQEVAGSAAAVFGNDMALLGGGIPQGQVDVPGRPDPGSVGVGALG
jgi:hypothetical protein